MTVKVLGWRKTPVTSKVSLVRVRVWSLLVTETLDRGVKLSKEDRQVATDLWDNVINPACIEFEKRTGKPAEAMREAIAGVITRRVNRRSSWNAWQKIWWNRLPELHDQAYRSKSATLYNCPLD